MEIQHPKFAKGEVVNVVICGDTLFTGEVVSVCPLPNGLLYRLYNPLTHKRFVEYERNLRLTGGE